MLASLRRSDTQTRSAALMAAARALLPEPTENSAEVGGLAAEVMQEIDKKIQVKKGDEFSTVLKQRILLKELQDEILGTSAVKEIRARIGRKGLLSPSLYDVRFGEAFLECNVPMGVSKALAEHAINQPTQFEHLFPEQSGLIGVAAQSLFSAPVHAFENCWLVVLTIRDDATLTVDGGWLVFLDDVGVSPHAMPSEMLRALAEKYGRKFRVDQFEGKFLMLQKLEHTTGAVIEWDTDHRAIDSRASWAVSPGLLKVGLVFSIDLVDYIRELKRRGVKVTRQTAIPEEAKVRFELRPDGMIVPG